MREQTYETKQTDCHSRRWIWRRLHSYPPREKAATQTHRFRDCHYQPGQLLYISTDARRGCRWIARYPRYNQPRMEMKALSMEDSGAPAPLDIDFEKIRVESMVNVKFQLSN